MIRSFNFLRFGTENYNVNVVENSGFVFEIRK